MPESPHNATKPPARQAGPMAFATLAGIFFAITLVKFGNPVILDSKVVSPENLLQLIIQPWPLKWGYIMLLPLIAVGLCVAQWKIAAPKWVLWLPVAWLAWQFIAATQTIDVNLTTATVKHYTACVVLFYLGCFGLKGWRNPWPLWIGLTLAFLWMIYMGFDQHFGGLAETRKYFYEQPDWKNYPPEFLQKIASERIYSTLFYPNTLAGAILLLLPITATFIWQSSSRLESPSRWLLVGLISSGALACLYWSGSKAGWLLMLLLIAAALLYSTISTLWKRRIIYLLLGIGLTGFGLKYAKFFQKGSTSVVARGDYWKAAAQTALQHPLFGTGPGTFAIPYAKIKNPTAEMARLVHNDYLEQASDSGLIGFITFSAIFIVTIPILYRCSKKNIGNFEFSILLGIIALLCHSFLEFHLFIPTLAWLLFFLLGWLWRLDRTGVGAASVKKSSNSEKLNKSKDYR